jgi:hypothetical protein
MTKNDEKREKRGIKEITAKTGISYKKRNRRERMQNYSKFLFFSKMPKILNNFFKFDFLFREKISQNLEGVAKNQRNFKFWGFFVKFARKKQGFKRSRPIPALYRLYFGVVCYVFYAYSV